MKPCSILYLVGGFSIGGTERHLSQVIPRIQSSGKRVSVCALGADGPMSEPLKEAGVRLEFIGSRINFNVPRVRGVMNLLSQTRQVAKRIRQLQPDIVHCFLSEPCSIGWLATRLSRSQHLLVMSKRSQLIRPQAFSGEKRLEQHALRRADHVIGHSQAVVDELSTLGIDRDRLHLIHNGICPTVNQVSSRADLRQHNEWSNETTVFVSLANLIPYKGHQELIEAFYRLDNGSTKDWVLLLLGGGEDSDYGRHLQQQVQSLGLQDKVRFVGQVDNPQSWLETADVGVLLSHHEGFSNAILEYMAARLPVIATAVGGNLDAVNPDQNGWLVTPGDDEALHYALSASFDGQQREQKGQAGYLRYLQEFTLDACMEKYNNLYATITA